MAGQAGDPGRVARVAGGGLLCHLEVQGYLAHGDDSSLDIFSSVLGRWAQHRGVASDEPRHSTGNLDPDSKVRILDLLFEQAAEAGAAVLAVTHDHDLPPRFERVLDFAQFRQEGAV